ncbi:MAG TPA: response regulator, partial [Ferruginibacter sp.]|nr:response regulator [Ferruginibacter sp.]
MIWKAVIVDDEPMASSFLQKYCEKHGGIDVLAVFHKPEEASDFLRQTAIDILFLDVEMPGSTGFQLLDILPYMPKVVLTTSKTDYAFDAFQYHVSDYLKKPFTYVRFQEAVNKIIHAGEKQIPAE